MGNLKTNPEMSPAEETAPIEVSVPIGISVADFSTVMASINGLYKEVGKDLGATDVTDLMVSRHREGSLVIECKPALVEHADPSEAARVSKVVLDGLEQLTKGERPIGFTNAALRHVSRISRVAISDDSAVIVGGSGRSIKCSLTLDSTVNRLVELRTKSWGSVEGKIQMISLRGTYRFNIYEVLTDERIACNIDDNLLEEVKEALGNRVVVYGEIHKKGGEFEYVKVEKIHRRPPPDKLPGFADIYGIFADSEAK